MGFGLVAVCMSDIRAEQNRRAAASRRKRIRSILMSYKTTVGCVECGYAENPDALHIEHIKPALGGRSRRDANGRTLEFLRGKGSYRAMWDILLSLETQVMCANCHSIKSASEARERNEAMGIRAVL